MNDRSLAEHAAKLFGSLEKWTSIFELHSLTDNIMNQWFRVGGEALRQGFEDDPVSGWKCIPWDEPRDSRWFLEDPGKDSIGIGIGWPDQELHLFAPKSTGFDRVYLDQALKDKRFERLLNHFDKPRGSGTWNGSISLAANRRFNPIGAETEGGAPRRQELAWYAGHETERYAKAMADIVRSIITDQELVERIRELDGLAREQLG